MAEVGVLNLTIQDNSEQAAAGLDKLVGALRRVKNAVAGGLKLEQISLDLEKLGRIVTDSISGSTVAKLTELAEALEKLSSVGSVNVKINFGKNSMGKESDTIRDAINEASAMARETAEGFTQIETHVSTSTEYVHLLAGAVEETRKNLEGATAQVGEFENAFRRLWENMNQMRMSKALESGTSLINQGQMQDTGAFGNLKDGAIEVEYTVTDALKRLEQVEDVVQEIKTNTIDEQSKTESINNALEEQLRLRKEILEAQNQKRLEDNYAQYRELYLSKEGNWQEQVPEMYGFTPKALEEGETYAEALKITMKEVDEYVDKFIEATNTPAGPLLRDQIDQAFQANLAMKDVQQSASVLKNAPAIAESMKQVESSAQEVSNSFNKGGSITRVLTENMKNLDKELRSKKKDMENVAASARSMSQRFSDLMFGTNGLDGAFKRMFPTLSGLWTRFKSMAKLRAMRYIIRELASGISEGLKNVYFYSKAVGTDFAPAMNSAASALAQMKNSIGAAIAPLLQSLIPLLRTVVSWFIQGINVVNQFFSLLRGQKTWTRAVETTVDAYEDNTKKAAKTTSKAIKDMLADWDELNIIQSDSGKNGSGNSVTGAAEDYTKMFEQVSQYDGWIKTLVDGIKDQFGDVLTLAKKVGVAILGWKFASAFAGLIGTLGSIIAFAGVIDLEFNIVSMFDKNFLRTGDEGWLIGDLLTTLLGGVLMKKILSKVLGGSLAKLAIPITLAVSAFAGIKTLLGDTDTTALTPESLELSALNALKDGALAGYLVYEAGFTGGLAFGVGTAASLFFMGVNIGMKAISDTMDTREITEDTIKANFLSAGLVSAGLMLGEAILGGTVGTIIGVGVGGAVLTLGALFAIEALIASEPVRVQWGDYKATSDEIRAFVEDSVFSVAPRAKISLANTQIEELGKKKEELRQSAEDVIGTLDSVRLGLVSSASADLKTKVKTLVDNFNQTASSYQNALKIAFELVPLKSDDGTDQGSEILKNSQSRWGELNSTMTKLANDLTKQFDIAYDESLDKTVREDAQKSIEKISGMMTQIAEAISGGQARAKAVHSLNTQIANLAHSSFDELINVYKEEKDKLVEELTKIGSDAAEGLLAQQYAYEKLAEYALKEAGGNVNDKTYQYYMDKAKQAEKDYKAAIDKLAERAEKTAEETLEKSEGQKKIREALLGTLKWKVSDREIEEVVASAGYFEPERFGQYFIKQLKNGNTDKAKADFQEFVDSMLADFVGVQNYQTFKSAIDAGIISYADIFDSEFLKNIAKTIGLEGNSEEANKLWNQFVEALLSGDIDQITVGIDKIKFKFDNDPLAMLKSEIEEALKDGIMSVDEKIAILTKYGVEEYNQALKELNYNLDAQGRKTGSIPRPAAVLAGGAQEYMGRGSNGSAGYAQGATLVQTEPANNQQEADNVANGTRLGTSGLLEALNSILRVAEAINRKEFTVNVTPGSNWGSFNAKSNEAYDKVTG